MEDDAGARSKTRDPVEARRRVLALAREEYWLRWGEVTSPAEMPLLSVPSRTEAWGRGKVERASQKQFPKLRAALIEAASLAQVCEESPHAAEGEALIELKPALLRFLDRVDARRDRTRVVLNEASRPTRREWLTRFEDFYYAQPGAMDRAPRRELGVLSVLSEFWPDRWTDEKIAGVGVSANEILSAESDLMDRHRKSLFRDRNGTRRKTGKARP